MNRRSFFKTLFVAACVPFLHKSESQEDLSVIDEPQDGNYTEFPDTIVGIEKFQDRLIVACEHSVWELYQDNNGLFSRKLLFYT